MYRSLEIDQELTITCPDCGGTTVVKYDGVFCGVLYGCAECGLTFKDEEKKDADKPQ